MEKETLRFFTVLVLFLLYLAFNVWRYGGEGFLVSLLTWSFFVLSTPIADAGLLFDLPVRILTGISMVRSEVLVWLFAILLNVISLIFFPEVYDKTVLLSVFKHILLNPIPYWAIILLSAVGTFTSLFLAEDIVSGRIWRVKREWTLLLLVLLLTLVFYYYLLAELGIHII